NYGASTPIKSLAGGTSAVVTNTVLTGLNPVTLYHFCVVASNAAGSSVGSDVTFTSTIAPPTATTLAASNITSASAALGASINPGGGATSFYFQYGTNTSYGASTPTSILAAGTNTVVTNTVATGINPATPDHFRLMDYNSVSGNFGTDLTFTTAIAAPQAATLAASNITSAGATLNASINPGGGVTSYYFQYGTTTNYGAFSSTNTVAAGIATVVANS